MTTDESQLDSLPVEEQAAYWLGVLNDEPTPDNYAEFDKWIASSPTHVTAFAKAQDLDNHVRDLIDAHLIDVDALVQSARREHQSQRRRNWAMGTAAAAAASVIALVGLSIHFDSAPEKIVAQPHVTTTHQDLVHLDDGSRVALDTHSAMRVALSADARDTYLDKGRAIFRVRPDSNRPFRVHVGATVAEALGTEFDVQKIGDGAVISVLDGVVQVAPSAVSVGDKPTRITAGFSVTVHQDGRIGEPQPIVPAAITAWRRSEERRDFFGEPLATIVQALNQYSAAPKITIEGDDVAQRRYVLALTSASTTALIDSLRVEDPELEIIQQGDDVVIRQRND